MCLKKKKKERMNKWMEEKSKRKGGREGKWEKEE